MLAPSLTPKQRGQRPVPISSPRENTNKHKVAVVGGGWSGISAAWRLHQAGVHVTLYDEGLALGGRSTSAKLGSKTVTLGGKNIGTKYELFREFASAQGAEEFEHFGINSARVEDGQIRSVDGNARVKTMAGFLRHTPPRDVLQLLKLVRLVRKDNANRFLGGPGFVSLVKKHDLSIDRRFGSYITSQLIRPMTIRMNGAEPDEAFLGNFGTNLGMLLDQFDQLTEGFDPLFSHFQEVVDVQLGHAVEQIHHEAGRVTGLTLRTESGAETGATTEAVVLAIPSWDSARLLSPIDEEFGALLREVEYFPVAVAMADYDNDVFSKSIRGLVFPKTSVVSNAGAYGATDLNIVRYTFSGRQARGALSESLSTSELLDIAENELDALIPVKHNLRRHTVSASWKHGLCAYGPDHNARLKRISAKVDEFSGLALAGDYIQGASIEACFRAGKFGAESVLSALNHSHS